MRNKLLILLMCTLFGCARPSDTLSHSSDGVSSVSIPVGFSVIEHHPDGFYIRLTSAQRATPAIIRSIADTLADKFDRIDLCLDVAHERGDEYASIIGSQVFDYDNDRILSLDKLH